jgi:hypothetical protein
MPLSIRYVSKSTLFCSPSNFDFALRVWASIGNQKKQTGRVRTKVHIKCWPVLLHRKLDMCSSARVIGVRRLGLQEVA